METVYLKAQPQIMYDDIKAIRRGYHHEKA